MPGPGQTLNLYQFTVTRPHPHVADGETEAQRIGCGPRAHRRGPESTPRVCSCEGSQRVGASACPPVKWVAAWPCPAAGYGVGGSRPLQLLTGGRRGRGGEHRGPLFPSQQTDLRPHTHTPLPQCVGWCRARLRSPHPHPSLGLPKGSSSRARLRPGSPPASPRPTSGRCRVLSWTSLAVWLVHRDPRRLSLAAAACSRHDFGGVAREVTEPPPSTPLSPHTHRADWNLASSPTIGTANFRASIYGNEEKKFASFFGRQGAGP